MLFDHLTPTTTCPVQFLPFNDPRNHHHVKSTSRFSIHSRVCISSCLFYSLPNSSDRYVFQVNTILWSKLFAATSSAPPARVWLPCRRDIGRLLNPSVVLVRKCYLFRIMLNHNKHGGEKFGVSSSSVAVSLLFFFVVQQTFWSRYLKWELS